MNGKVAASITFFCGGAIGGFISWIFTKRKYQQLLNQAVANLNKEKEEITIKSEEVIEDTPKEIQESQEKPSEIVTDEIQTIKQDPYKLENDLQKKAAMVAREKPNIVDYTKKIRELNYVPESESEEYSEYPYLITPDKIPFGEKEDKEGIPYDKITLIYYEDGVIADTTDEIIDNVNDVIGNESLSHFGDFPNKDSIFVRNDRLRADFEVCMSELSWEEDVLVRKPYLRDA